MFSILALAAVESILNRIIDLDTISRIHLNALQGQCLRVVVDSPSLSIDMLIDHDKLRFEPTSLGHAEQASIFEQRPFDVQATVAAANATLHVTDLVSLAKLLLSSEQHLANIPIQGDYQLLFSLKKILAQAELDLAAHLSPWLGADLAHELGKLQRLPNHMWRTAQSVESMLQESLKEDSGLFAARWQMQDLHTQTRHLEQTLDRLEAKTQQLQLQMQVEIK